MGQSSITDTCFSPDTMYPQLYNKDSALATDAERSGWDFGN